MVITAYYIDGEAREKGRWRVVDKINDHDWRMLNLRTERYETFSGNAEGYETEDVGPPGLGEVSY